MASHPVSEFANSYFSVESVLYTPGLFQSFSEDLRLPLADALRIPAIKGKYDSYKNEVFCDALNRSETITLVDDYLQLRLTGTPLKICVFRLVNLSDVKGADILKEFEIEDIQSTSLCECVCFDPNLCDQEEIEKVLVANNAKEIDFSDETPRDCYLRCAYKNGYSKEKFLETERQYQNKVEKNLKEGKPKGEYDKNTDEFMQESGYPVPIKSVDLRTYMQKVYAGELKVGAVTMQDGPCINHGDLPKRLLTNERPKPKMGVEKTVDIIEIE